jgi:hypothetical protein
VKRGDIDACSWAFKLEDGDDDFADGYDDDGKRCVIRSIRNVSNLWDVSVVTNPAYDATSVQARAATFIGTLFPGEIEVIKARLHRQYQSIAADFRALGMTNSTLQRTITAKRNGISTDALLDAELRVQAERLGREIELEGWCD